MLKAFFGKSFLLHILHQITDSVINMTFFAHGEISIKLFTVYLHIINERLSYKFHPYSILTGHTKVESVAYQVLSITTKQQTCGCKKYSKVIVPAQSKIAVAQLTIDFSCRSTTVLKYNVLFVNPSTVFPRIVSALEQFPPLNSFRGNYSSL